MATCWIRVVSNVNYWTAALLSHGRAHSSELGAGEGGVTYDTEQTKQSRLQLTFER